MKKAYITMLRPSQWLKNLMIFFPPFLAGHFLLPGVVIRGLLPFGAFCLVSSSGYIFNDLLDRERDLHHPQKSLRALPSGAVSISGSAMLSLLLLVSGLSLSCFVSLQIFMLILGYAVVSFLYSIFLKRVPVFDLFCISTGFLIRLQTGGDLFQIPISPWMFLTVFLLAVFLSTGKRLSESRSLGDAAVMHRQSLETYPPGLLEGIMFMTGGAVLVTYAMYSLVKPRLLYSVPLCVFGLLRYLLRIKIGKNGDPTESLLKDPVLFTVGIVWILMVAWSIYW